MDGRRVSPRAATGACRSLCFRIGSVDAVGRRRTSIDRRSFSRCFSHSHSQSHGRASQHDLFAVQGRNVMKTHYSVTLAILAGFGLGAVAVEGLRAQAKPPVYQVVEIDPSNTDAYA